ncbi:MAG: DUF3775 domain-containing protein [Nostoc sp.]|uniref:DUF3775 domain-containing protein n=1 Tax=Nostoc sp. TaxID=1180 RepID=UPI002FFBFFB3
MILLSINKIYKVIEIAELVYTSRKHGMTKNSESFIYKMSNYLEDFNITGRCSVKILHKYIDEFSEEEKVELIALIWLGRGISNGQLEDFPNLVKQLVELIPKNYRSIYIIEKPLLAKNLRDGLQKLDICNFYSS